MTKFLQAMFFISTLFIFFSCQREFSPTNEPIVPVTNDSTLLLKYVQLDSSAGGQLDTSLIMNYTYDNSKRLTSLYMSDSGSNQYYSSFNLFYNNTDTLPYKITTIENTPGAFAMQTFDTTFFTYNSDGLVATDSIAGKEVSTSDTHYHYGKKIYQYSTGKIIVYKTGVYSKANFGIPETDSVILTLQNGNILSQSVFTYDTTSTATTNSDFAGTYDTHPNPFHFIPGFYFTSPFIEVDVDMIGILQKNNCTRNFQSDNSGWQSLITATYSYKTNGYPSVSYIVNSPISPAGTITYSRGIFTYGIR